MKVICIDAKPFFPENAGLLREGSEYTVIGEDSDFGYLLAEVKTNHNPEYGFRKTRFLPLSDIDENEHLTQKDKLFKELAETLPEKELPQQPFERGWRDLALKLEGAV